MSLMMHRRPVLSAAGHQGVHGQRQLQRRRWPRPRRLAPAWLPSNMLPDGLVGQCLADHIQLTCIVKVSNLCLRTLPRASSCCIDKVWMFSSTFKPCCSGSHY